MSDIRLITEGERELRPLVEAALGNELRLIEAGIRQAERRLKEFEEKYETTTKEFISDYERDEREESMEFAEWIGESRLIKRLQEKADTIREIRFEN
jgi:hypothetical protein